MTARAQERAAEWPQGVFPGEDKGLGAEGHFQSALVDCAHAGKIAAFWSAHMGIPINAAEVVVMLRLAELAMGEK